VSITADCDDGNLKMKSEMKSTKRKFTEKRERVSEFMSS